MNNIVYNFIKQHSSPHNGVSYVRIFNYFNNKFKEMSTDQVKNKLNQEIEDLFCEGLIYVYDNPSHNHIFKIKEA